MTEGEAKRLLRSGHTLRDVTRKAGITFKKFRVNYPEAYAYFLYLREKKRKAFLKKIWRIWLRKEERGEPYHVLQDIFGISYKLRITYYHKLGLSNTGRKGQLLQGYPCRSCTYFSTCRDCKLACDRFVHFVEFRGYKEDVSQVPDRQTFKQLFPREP